MKRIAIALCTMMLAFVLSTQVNAATPTKAQKRIAYTIKNLKLNNEQKTALTPMLASYLAEVKAAKETYSNLKDKLKNAIDKGTLTDSQAQQLMKAKYEFEAKEVTIKQKYMTKFASAIPYKKVYVCFDLINDKMSKIEGKKQAKDDDDD